MANARFRVPVGSRALPALLALSAVLALGPPALARAAGPAAAPGAPPVVAGGFRVAVLYLGHETTTFLARDTRREDFVYPGSPMTGEQVLKVDEDYYVGGFVRAMRDHPDVELVGIESPNWPRNSSGSGWIAQDAYEHFVGRMIEQLKAEHSRQPIHGAYLALHGGMAVRGVPDPEAELARRVRAALGPAAAIAGTFDLHGNEDEGFLAAANFAFTTKYFPHYDSPLQGERAAHAIVRMLRGHWRPVHAVRRPGIVTPTVYQWTGQSPWIEMVQRALVWEAREPNVVVNLFFGFPWSDVANAGMTIQVTTHDDPALAGRIADDMAGFVWRRRCDMFRTTPILSVEEAVARAHEASADGAPGTVRWPVVIGDYSDRSGSATWVLAESLRRGLEHAVFATVADEEAIRRLERRRPAIGSEVELDVGGRVDASAGEPVKLRGRLRFLGPVENAIGSWAAIDVGRGNVVIVSSNLEQIVDPAEIRKAGLSERDFRVFVLKSRVHFRRGFDDTGFARTIVLAEPPGRLLGTVHLQELPYENLQLRRTFPFSALTNDRDVREQLRNLKCE